VSAKVWAAANTVMALLFVFSVLVQINDPDPLLWMLIYGAAAAVSFSEIRRGAAWWAPAAVAATALVWAGTIAPRVLGNVPFLSMFAEFEMKDVGVEESREMYGLLLIALWMLAILTAALRRRRAANATAPGSGR
jgi:hypothetical protein